MPGVGDDGGDVGLVGRARPAGFGEPAGAHERRPGRRRRPLRPARRPWRRRARTARRGRPARRWPPRPSATLGWNPAAGSGRRSLTSSTGPGNDSSDRAMAAPSLPGEADAPMTAMPRGANSASSPDRRSFRQPSVRMNAGVGRRPLSGAVTPALRRSARRPPTIRRRRRRRRPGRRGRTARAWRPGRAADVSSTSSAGVPRTMPGFLAQQDPGDGEPPLTATTAAPAAMPASSSATAPARPASSSGAVSHRPQSAPATGASPGGRNGTSLVAAAAAPAAHPRPRGRRGDRHDPPVELAAAQRQRGGQRGSAEAARPPARHVGHEAGVAGGELVERDGPGEEVEGELGGVEVVVVAAEVLPPRQAGPGRALDLVHRRAAGRLEGLEGGVEVAGVLRQALHQGGGVLHGHLRAGADREVGGVGGVAEDHDVALTASGRSGSSGSCPTGSC